MTAKSKQLQLLVKFFENNFYLSINEEISEIRGKNCYSMCGGRQEIYISFYFGKKDKNGSCLCFKADSYVSPN